MEVQVQTQVQSQIDEIIELKKIVDETWRLLNELYGFRSKLAKEYKKLGDYVDVTMLKRSIKDLVEYLDEHKQEYPTLSALVKAKFRYELPFFWLEERVTITLKEALLLQHMWKRKKEPLGNIPRIIRLCDKILDTIYKIDTNLSRIHFKCSILDIPLEKIDEF